MAFEPLLFSIRLHENSRKFLESAIEIANQEWSPELSLASINIITGIELLLKARLASEDFRLLAVDGGTTVAQFEAGDFKSITVDECLKRLKQFGVSLDSRQKQVLKNLQDLRNRTIHYITPKEAEFRGAVEAGLNLYIEFHQSQFDHWDNCYNLKSLNRLIIELHRNEDFVRARFERIKPRLEVSYRPRTHYFDECPSCVQDAVIINDGYFECLFCDYENEISFAVEQRSNDKRVEVCPACSKTSLAWPWWFPELTVKECFCCGYFEGDEPNWSDWKNPGFPTPRLHSDRRDR
ncbi:MAG: hypothetical protein JST12_08845 [Armatimonadetes bacterium]|nr:hypothetical protein [Armatimonadota bacterium]